MLLPDDRRPVADTALTAAFDLPLSAQAAALARRTVTDVLHGWDVHDPDYRYDVLLVTSELVTNAVRHGGRRVHLQLVLDGCLLRLTVGDGSAVAPVVRQGHHDESGRGMAIVGAVASAWGVHDRTDGKDVWADLPLPTVPGQRRADGAGVDVTSS